jgi:hypothetical protein
MPQSDAWKYGKHWEFFTLVGASEGVRFSSATQVNEVGRDHPISFHLIKDPQNLILRGLFVEFLREEEQIDANLVIPTYKELRVKFVRGVGTLDVTALTEE